MKLLIPIPKPKAQRIVFFPHSGSGPGPYLQWQPHLPEFELAGVEYPGRGSQFCEPLLTNMEELLENVSGVDFGERPIFFGHSLGALIAFEVARQLELINKGPSVVIVSALPSPTSEDFRTRYPDTIREQDLFRLLESFSPEMLLAVQEDQDLKDILLDTLRSDFEILKNYRGDVTQPLNCPLRIFRGRDDNMTLSSQEQWRELSLSRSVPTREFPGGHFYFLGQQEVLSRAIREVL